MSPVAERQQLLPESPEYAEVLQIFNRHTYVRGRNLTVGSIERVSNERLRKRFEREKSSYRDDFDHVTVWKLWHGTDECNVSSILENNYDIHRHGQHVGHRFGPGISFSSKASYASHYADKNSRTGYLLLNDVLVSNVVEVAEHRSFDRPPLLPDNSGLRYDTTAKNEDTLDVAVKYDPDAILPTHVVKFKRW